MNSPPRQKICFVAAATSSIKVFMKSHILKLSQSHDVTLIANGASQDLGDLLGPHIAFIPVRIERDISIKNDLRALAKLWTVFRDEKFTCVHSITPKAGLLSMLASKMARVPIRLHTFTGQVWATKHGAKRILLKTLDKITSAAATGIFADSRSQAEFLIENKVIARGKITVLANGSIAGVNISRFKRDLEARSRIRRLHDIPVESVVFLFVGRLVREKGILELLEAFGKVASKNEAAHLFIVGPDEEGLQKEIDKASERFPGRFHQTGFTDAPQDYMSSCDVFCLPSHREGFGSVIIEAAAVGLPSIASKIYGITDAIEEGETGLLHRVGEVGEMAHAMNLLAEDPAARRRMAVAAKERASTKFSEEKVTEALMNFYEKVLL